jgi:hypothetical protein
MNIVKTFNGPRHLEYVSSYSRERSFNCGLHGCKVFSSAGFFFSSNQLICFYCGLQLPITTSKIIIKTNHSYLSPGCAFNILNSLNQPDPEYLFENDCKF